MFLHEQRLAAAKARTVPDGQRTARQRYLLALDDRRIAASSRGLEAFLRWAELEIDRRERWEIFAERGISPTVAVSRPYVRWTRESRQSVRQAYKSLPLAGQRAAMVRRAGQCDGFVITRHAPPGLGLDPVYAELRPDEAVETGTIEHDHEKAFAGKPARRAKHIDMEHGGADLIGLHKHPRTAKYLFPPNPLRERRYKHDHAECYAHRPEKRAQHVRRHHEGVDRSGLHGHTYLAEDKTNGRAKRLDMHPLAVPLFENAPRAFFSIEGCFKADSILSKGEAAFSVPSVTLWDAPELLAFAEKYLAGKLVIVVPDADWRDNWLVTAQAMLCRSFLRQRCGLRALVAAPPDDRNEAGELKYKGIDDFLGAGGSLDDLVVIGREMPPAFDQWVRDQRGRSDGLLRDADVLQNLALHADTDGTIRKALGPIAKIMRTHHSRVARGITSLEEREAITIEGSLYTRRGLWEGGYFDRSLNWENQPTIIIAEELRAVELEPIRLGDLERDVPQQLTASSTEELQELIRRRGREPAQVSAVAA